ncbi:MotA/TolQ/ExbB proton channel family protein [Fibrobacter sp.]|uniref:MotA/TolQ/ExbB proton channel family protein n=1 Tax=Fibrobacter sp. TaxID=35828 RepID=UPI0025BA8E91|nr:MotA/TolQ/ExbB proton channel family protein [Fibrobacter sp.]MBR2057604.1 MotA/TolQ/ExbB proton channel family protein [Fibrobacter sp.]MBR4007983.1 MotA/TolQ/ExbB proton channel family protein [Fibrobacter sp.]
MTNTHYILIESLENTYHAGGVVMLPILLAGVVGFYYLFSSWFRIGSDFFRTDIHKVIKRMRVDLNGGIEEDEKNAEPPSVKKALRRLRKRGGLLSRELCYAIDVASTNPEGFRDYMQVRMMKTVRYMEQGNHIVSVMASAAPLLGLLGTVTGMVSTFEVITLYGNQNPVLMADGISEALISTQSGLLVAFPLTLLKQRLDERVEMLRQKMELGATVIENYFVEKEAVAIQE